MLYCGYYRNSGGYLCDFFAAIAASGSSYFDTGNAAALNADRPSAVRKADKFGDKIL